MGGACQCRPWAWPWLGITRMPMPKVVQWYNKTLFLVYSTIQLPYIEIETYKMGKACQWRLWGRPWLGLTRMLMMKVVHWYNETSFIFHWIIYLWYIETYQLGWACQCRPWARPRHWHQPWPSITTMPMLQVVQWYNENLVYLPLNNLSVVYRDIQNGVGMTVQVVRLAIAMELALAMPQHYQNADAKGCMVI